MCGHAQQHAQMAITGRNCTIPYFLNVFLKRDGNIELHVSITFPYCGNTKIHLIMFPPCFLNGIVTSCFRHISVSRFPLLFVSVTFLQRIFNLFVTIRHPHGSMNRVYVKPGTHPKHPHNTPEHPRNKRKTNIFI